MEDNNSQSIPISIKTVRAKKIDNDKILEKEIFQGPSYVAFILEKNTNGKTDWKTVKVNH